VQREKRPSSRAENLITVVAVAIPVVWLGFIIHAYMNRSAEKQEIAHGIANCRQIIAALRTYASDHDGGVPEASGAAEETGGPETANACFRALFQEKVVDKEFIFGCPRSPYVPDGTIGAGPHFPDALKAGENHWMMTKGLPDTVGGTVPFVYENATGAAWNPTWNADRKREPAPGRTWSEGIIVGLSDNSVALQKLAAPEGSAVSLRPSSAAGKNLFTQQEKSFEVLDIER
jgi:hypothetical protein